MPIEVHKCPSCAAPVPPGTSPLVACAYCGSTLSNVPAATWSSPKGPLPPDPAAERWDDHALPRLGVAGRLYVLLGLLGRGESCDVFLARRDSRLTEMVVIKVLRALSDRDLLEREWRTLEALSKSDAKGSDYFATLLPQRVGHGPVATPDGLARKASVFRWRSGFQHTLEEVFDAHPHGIDPRTAVWMWKRVLELLGWVHKSGWIHGAILPQHVLVHPRDHGVVLAGWSCASRAGTSDRLPATSAAARAFYPEDAWSSGTVSPAIDIAMTARCFIRALGGDPARGTLPLSVPEPLGVLLATHADPSESADRTDDAWTLLERVGEAGKLVYGEPRHHPFVMPGWS
jgi:hypothetical protein